MYSGGPPHFRAPASTRTRTEGERRQLDSVNEEVQQTLPRNWNGKSYSFAWSTLSFCFIRTQQQPWWGNFQINPYQTPYYDLTLCLEWTHLLAQKSNKKQRNEFFSFFFNFLAGRLLNEGVISKPTLNTAKNHN